MSESREVSGGIFNWKTLQLPYLTNASQFNWFSECFFVLICLLKYWNVSCPFFLDFDEQTADDWDVDMSVYYDKGMLSLFYQIALSEQNWISSGDSNFFSLTDGGDMDARDYVRMRYEKRLREGREDTSGHNKSIGSFERFTKVRKWIKWLMFYTTAWWTNFTNKVTPPL